MLVSEPVNSSAARSEEPPGGNCSSYIGHVDKSSAAELGGLRSGDRVIEVGGVNVETADYDEIVERISSVDDNLELLVVDDASDR